MQTGPEAVQDQSAQAYPRCLHSELFVEFLRVGCCCLFQSALLGVTDGAPQVKQQRLLGKLAQIRVLQRCREVTWVCLL